MKKDTFRQYLHEAVDWGADYRESLRDRPVRSPVKPGEFARQIDAAPPESGESMDVIMQDFGQLVPGGMTHWQHPRFFAYFPANAAPASIIAETLVNSLAAQCMLWQTSPAATELETCMVDWLRQALGLPDDFKGVIQDSASSATLAAVLTMRELALQRTGNTQGLSGQPTLRVYSSSEAHTSIDRAIWISGIGSDHLVRIPTSGKQRGMDIKLLVAAIEVDLAAGKKPAGIIANLGATGVGSTDSIAELADVAEHYGLYLHVDAAWAGSAMMCPEFRHLARGWERADSIVFNPHKWLGAQFDCSVQLLREPSKLVETLAISPEYLKTHGHDGLINYSEWSVPLGRRFRALKLWFLMRSEGLEGLRQMMRNHIKWSENLAAKLDAHPDFEIVTEPMLSLFSFRHRPQDVKDLDAHNQTLTDAINNDGRIYLTQTRIEKGLIIRFQCGSCDCTEEDVMMAYEVITEVAEKLKTA